jgi:hypothetical protein
MTHASGLTRLLVMGMLSLSVSGCLKGAVSDSAVCAGTAQATTDHAAALAKDGGPLSVVTGAFLIRQLDAGCNR